MPVHLSSPHQLISPASAACPRGTSETITIKSFNYPSGSTPVAGVKGKFLLSLYLEKFVGWICL